ncbi:DNA-formamidopyrimidine glycosylase [Marinithermus hydrothermalis]|uniref:Formamidopyrimidine-DNA glycosylase n=1 Tax=Marinithermus hydrothermalis (strain DSM 14884 / JCM 11576 / T1) TaxID=869210 RepID=F2NP16_MARHT|nr:DNA-formamidopyrimidine glycosylase [Marinithermus hydrothermalis]AEB11604.1 Formamidopyrimidine-DNA glycosylase [Marinithermus hydrothermalis DSM 14884]
MPELPEVETTRQALRPYLEGRAIRAIHHTDPARYRRTEDAVGRRVEVLRRRGKFLIAALEGGLELVVHLGMTGGFRFAEGPHVRVRLEVPDRPLYFNDPRRFGRWWVVPAGAYREIPLLDRLGPEPLSDAFTLEGFREGLARTARGVKAVLLAQEVVAGLGNIYADEALWRAGVHPARPANTLEVGAIARLYTAIREVLAEAVAAGGSTLQDGTYRRPDGALGRFQVQHKVYGRPGAPCVRCGTPILKAVVAGRGTHFCPRCQA